MTCLFKKQKQEEVFNVTDSEAWPDYVKTQKQRNGFLHVLFLKHLDFLL